MLQTITREWQIAKTYIYDVALHEGVISLDWDDFQAFAEGHRPLIAVRAEGDTAVNQLVDEAMREIRKHCTDRLSGLIVSISYKKDDEIMMDEMFGLNDCMESLANDGVDIKWGVALSDYLDHKRSVYVFAFE